MKTRIMFVGVLFVFGISVIWARDFDPNFNQSPDLAEFRKVAKENSSFQFSESLSHIDLKVANALAGQEYAAEFKDSLPKPGPGYIYGPYPPLILNSSAYQYAERYPPQLHQLENPEAYQLLAQWDSINATRQILLTEANTLDVKDVALYNEGAQLDKEAAVLNAEVERYNASAAEYNKQCLGQPVNSYCTNWYKQLQIWKKDLEKRIDIHNNKVYDLRARISGLKKLVEDWLEKVRNWSIVIANFVNQARELTKDTGSCTKEQHYKLQQAVKAAYTSTPACIKGQDCSTLRANRENFRACRKARIEINETCFGGGDPGHTEQASNMLNGAIRCTKLLKEDCGEEKKAVFCEKYGIRRIVFETPN